jgi:hypothetical protein
LALKITSAMSESVAVVLLPAHVPYLPTEPPNEAHLTLVYAGDDQPDSLLSMLELLAFDMAIRHQAFPARQLGLIFLGQANDEPCISIAYEANIILMRSLLAMYSHSEYKEFRPHVAIPHATGKFPLLPWWLYFNRIALWVGDDHSRAWWLGTGEAVA